MRVLLVGTTDQRARLRAELDNASVTVVGEFSTLAAARNSKIQADAVLLADPKGPRRLGEDTFEEPLTAREVEILELLAEGLPNKGIAARLSISDQTVKFHVASICGKLDAANRTDAVRRAVRRGLIAL
jgi:DNA-binding NarL/FixJ family response regulator